MTADTQVERRKNKRNIWLIAISIIFLIAGAIWFLYWVFVGRFYVATEDAYVHGNEVMLSPQVSAAIKTIYADETDLVVQGQLVIELDTSNFELKVEEMQKSLADIVREVARLFQDVGARKAEVEVRKAEMRQAELDMNHRQPLVKTGAVSVEVFETYETSYLVAKANLELAEREFEAATVLVSGTTIRTHPRVLKAQVLLKDAYLDLIRCQIFAPATGYIAKRSAQVGDQVSMGQTLLFIVPLDEIWLHANFKETQLRNVRIGQPVSYTADLYGRSIQFHGSVEGFQPGSGDAFALLPPQNASGNWIKIIQRVPVRIKLLPEEIQKHPLLLGLSMRVHVDIHDTDGAMLATAATKKPIYTTFIYEKQLEALAKIQPMINSIVENNITS